MAPAEELAERMGKAFNALMDTHRDEILLSMQSYATPEPDVRAYAREKFAMVHELVKNHSFRCSVTWIDLLREQILWMNQVKNFISQRMVLSIDLG